MSALLYLIEVYQWFKEEDNGMARRFLQVFHTEMVPDLAEARTTVGEAELPIQGICEECETETEVGFVEGRWLCEECQEVELIV